MRRHPLAEPPALLHQVRRRSWRASSTKNCALAVLNVRGINGDPSEICALEFKAKFRRFEIRSISRSSWGHHG
jgi:hypothetical protein